MKDAKTVSRYNSYPADKTRRHLFTLLAVNLGIAGLIAAFFWYHQLVQDRIFDRIVHYHSVVARTVQSSLAELHYVSDGVWREALIQERPDAFSVPGHEAAAGHKTNADHISALTRQRETIIALQQRFADPRFADSTDSALRALDSVLLIGSPADPTQGNFSAQLELIENLDLHLRELLKLHMDVQDRMSQSAPHDAFNDPAYLLVMVVLLTSFGFVIGMGVIRSATAASTARETALNALRQNEKRLSRLADGLEAAQRIARIGNWEWDAESGAEWWSDENYRIIGFQPGTVEPASETFFNTIHEEDRDRVARTISDAEKTATHYSVDFRVVFPDGGERYIREIGEPLFDTVGRLTGQRGTIQDITEQHLAETGLAEAVRRLEAAQRIARVADWEWDPDSQFLDWPPQMRVVLGLPPSDEPITNDDFIAMVHPDDREILLEMMRRAVKDEVPYAMEYRIVIPGGPIRTIMEYGEPFTPAGSGNIRLRGTIQDVTTRKNAETQLAKAVADLNQAQRLAKVGSWVWDIASDEDMWSEECYRIHGLEPGSKRLTGTDYLAYIHPDDREAVRTAHERAISTGEPLNLEFRLRSAGDSIRIVQAHGEVSYDDQGNPQRMTGTVQDVSELRVREKEIREIQERFALAFQLSPSATAISDIETGVHVDVNDKWVETLGYSRDEAIGRTAAELGVWANPEDRARAVSLLKENGRFRDFEGQYRTRGGELRDFLISAEPFPIGDRPHMLIVGHDITERKAMEAELRETADRLEKSQRVGRVGSWVWEFEKNKEWWSNEVYRMFGMEIGNHTPNGFDFLDHVHPEDRERTRAGLERSIKEGVPFAGEYRVRCVDGREIVILEQSEVECDANGKPVRLRGMAQDITERKKAELVLQETKARLEEAQKLGQMGSWTWEPEENIEWWSDEQYRIFGLVPGTELLDGFGFLKYVHPDDRGRVEKIERDAANNRTPFSIEYRIVRPDGSERTVAEQGEWIEGNASGKSQWRGIIQDITERKRIEQDLAQLNAELELRVEERTAELRAAQDELIKRERLATLGQLTATVSHELRNPLGAIRTSLYVVEKKTANEDRRLAEAIGRINRSITRCDNIIDELLDFTRMRDLQFERLSLDQCLSLLLAEQSAPDGISVHRNFNGENVYVKVDLDRLQRAVINIYDNAWQAMLAGGKAADNAHSQNNHCLSITTRLNKGRAEMMFEDTGPGISGEELDRIFEPLYSTKNFGVGLGLPIVRQIMEQHGGGVEAANRENGGARFVLWLPVETEQTNAEVPHIAAGSNLH